MSRALKNAGFSLLELMIAIVIIGVLASIAIPSYLGYAKKAHYSEIVSATAPYKVGVVECYSVLADLSDCNGGLHGVPQNRLTSVSGIKSITVDAGIITVIPVQQNGIEEADTYILTPTVSDEILVWAASGGGVSKGYA